MVGTMLPIGYGERTRGGRPLSLLAYSVGSIAGGVTFGAALGLAGFAISGFANASASSQLTGLACGFLALLLALLDSSILPVSLPRTTRQVPSSWSRRYPPATFGFLYGTVLGVGIGTRVAVATFYVLPVMGLMTGNVLASALILGAFGLGRTLPLWLIGTRRAANGDELESLVSGIEMLAPVVLFLNGLIASTVGSFILASQLSNGGW